MNVNFALSTDIHLIFTHLIENYIMCIVLIFAPCNGNDCMTPNIVFSLI